MHLVSNKEQNVYINDLNQTYTFKKGESIHTENSHKFDTDTITELAREAGLMVRNSWTDNNKYFALSLFSLL
jgi:uncharacterized SAM-dependent methyltransferase